MQSAKKDLFVCMSDYIFKRIIFFYQLIIGLCALAKRRATAASAFVVRVAQMARRIPLLILRPLLWLWMCLQWQPPLRIKQYSSADNLLESPNARQKRINNQNYQLFMFSHSASILQAALNQYTSCTNWTSETPIVHVVFCPVIYHQFMWNSAVIQVLNCRPNENQWGSKLNLHNLVEWASCSHVGVCLAGLHAFMQLQICPSIYVDLSIIKLTTKINDRIGDRQNCWSNIRKIKLNITFYQSIIKFATLIHTGFSSGFSIAAEIAWNRKLRAYKHLK